MVLPVYETLPWFDSSIYALCARRIARCLVSSQTGSSCPSHATAIAVAFPSTPMHDVWYVHMLQILADDDFNDS